MKGRLSTLQAALVIARRDFHAILFSRSFIFFLLGPLFPVLVGAMAGGIGQRVQNSAEAPSLGVMMSEADTRRLQGAAKVLHEVGGIDLPELRPLASHGWSKADPKSALQRGAGGVIAIVSGSPEQPVLTGPDAWITRWQGPVSMLSAQATGRGPRAFPAVQLSPAASPDADARRGHLMTAQSAQMLLFLLTMLLAGMVLSNLVEEKGNKIIEILAAAIPMDAVFYGKLFAMLAVSFVGIGVWGAAGGSILLAGHAADPNLFNLPAPAVGWPMLFALGVIYFGMAYMLLGSLFLAIGSMATTVREVQTMSMPVTMMQLMVFFLASYAMTQPGSPVEIFAVLFPFSSPFAMIARASQDASLWPHALAIVWEVLWVIVLVRMGSAMFRKRVMKSGPAGAGKAGRSGRLARRKQPAAARG